MLGAAAVDLATVSEHKMRLGCAKKKKDHNAKAHSKTNKTLSAAMPGSVDSACI